MLIIDAEFKDLIPALTSEEYKGLEESICAEGCRDAIVCWNDTIVDGHNRYKICIEHNVPFTTVQKEFADRNEVKIWMMNNQLARRNLTDFQRIEIVRKCEDAVKAKAKERQGTRTDLTSGQNCPEVKRATEELAEMASVGRKTYEHAVTVLESAPEPIIQAARKNELSINAAYEVTKMPEEVQTEVAERIEQGEKAKDVVADVRAKAGVSEKTYNKAVKVIEEAKPEVVEAVRRGDMTINQAYQAMRRDEKEAVREEIRQANLKKIQKIDNPLETQGLFQTIVIDPAWDWGDEGDVNQFGRAKPDYYTMPIEDIEKLPVNKIADDNCHLYLWVTNRSLPKAFRLIQAWGFRYITCLTWVKPSFGMGNYFRGSTEQVLFAVKGSQPLKRHDVGTYFEAPRGKQHSSKPDKFYELVESCSYAPYIDIFGRQDRQGWSIWGENS